MFPQSAFIGTRFLPFILIVFTALAFCSPARCKDEQTEASKAAAHSRTLTRILTSWKARQERTKSFHFVWDSYAVQRGESFNDERKSAVSHFACWFDGDNYYRIEASTVATSKAKGLQRVNHDWTAFDGKIYSFLNWTEGSTLPARGNLRSFLRISPLNDELRALLLVLQPFGPRKRPEQFRLISENAIVNGVRCIKLQWPVGPQGFFENLWVDPREGDALVYWETQGPGGPWSPPISLNYRLDKKNGWIPIEWRTRSSNAGAMDQICRVKTFTINDKLSTETFRIHFPAGTAVTAAVDEQTTEKYIVAPDGSTDSIVKHIYDRKNQRHYIISPDRTKIDVFNLDSIRSRRFRNILQTPIDFRIAPQPLRDAIAIIGQRFQIPIAIDEKGFQAAGVEPSTEVEVDTVWNEGEQQMKIWEQLASLSAQCPRPFGIEEREGKLVLMPIVLPHRPAVPAQSPVPSKDKAR